MTVWVVFTEYGEEIHKIYRNEDHAKNEANHIAAAHMVEHKCQRNDFAYAQEYQVITE